ncbi:Outer membrane protein beta-barrel family protein [Lutibacter oricola]|uniref:Outer membrane protein beta-barrel family protein n=1 Tax=Lutibacter oricola TaxID=762486 RepID=A0A1H2TBD1_9FLAO|nr:TonB-dependent receptor [Lutibacter oricola]SDW41192.1 Outer membrane protein beta-barrel family protein [Lutibacter oricola]
MKKYILISFLFLTSFFGISQNVKLEGFVKDTKGKPLEMANVIAFKKGTKFLQSYSITDHNGKYKLSLEDTQEYTLKISYLGYDSLSADIKVDNSSNDITKNFELQQSSEKLNEVEITYEMPVKIVGDTIVYNSDSFTSGKEKKLEDVLEKLPGIEIDDNGEVEVEGKKVQKVLVEGKEFFDGDSKLATQNIPANAIDKVQVLRNYNEVSGMKGVTNNEDNIALNIKLKKGKNKFWFGEINAGIGENDKHIVKPKLFYYSPNKSINVLGDINNIGETPFTMRDYFRFTGGLRGSMNNSGTSFNVSEGGLGFTTAQNNRAQKIESKFGAVNFSYSPKKTLDLNGFAIVNDSETTMLTDSKTTYNNTGLVEDKETAALQGSKLGMIKFSTTYRPNTNVHLDYDIFGKISEQTELNDVTSSNRGAVDTYLEEQPASLNQNFNLYYTIDDKNIFAAEVQHLYQKDQPLYNSIASTQPFELLPSVQEDPTDLINLFQNSTTTTSKFDAKFDYYYLLNEKSNINLTLGSTFSKQNFESDIEQELENGTTENFNETELINDVDYNFTDLFLGVTYKAVLGDFTINPGVTLHQYTTNDKQLGTKNKNNLTKVLPSFYAKYDFNSSSNLRFNYAITTQFSDIEKVAEGYFLDRYNAISKGNRDIENSLRHRYSLSFFSFSMFSFTNIHANVSYSKNVNTVKNNTELIGIDRISYPINSIFADESVSGNFRYDKTYSKLKTRFKTSVSHNIYNNFVNNQAVKSKSLTHSYTASVATKFKDAPNFEIGYQKSFTDYSNTGSTTDKPFANMEIGFLKNFILTADYSYYNYENDEKTVTNNYSFLNANLYYQQPNSKWEFQISADNLTNNSSINRDSLNQIVDSNTTSLYFIQPRIWMFKVKYNI